MPSNTPKDVSPDEPLESSPSQIEEFKKTSVWRDMLRWLSAREENLSEALANAQEMGEIRKAQGAYRNVKDVQRLPDLLLEEIENIKQAQNGRQ
jgi:hypothetical protein